VGLLREHGFRKLSFEERYLLEMDGENGSFGKDILREHGPNIRVYLLIRKYCQGQKYTDTPKRVISRLPRGSWGHYLDMLWEKQSVKRGSRRGVGIRSPWGASHTTNVFGPGHSDTDKTNNLFKIKRVMVSHVSTN
jgi:hypothetical protein